MSVIDDAHNKLLEKFRVSIGFDNEKMMFRFES